MEYDINKQSLIGRFTLMKQMEDSIINGTCAFPVDFVKLVDSAPAVVLDSKHLAERIAEYLHMNINIANLTEFIDSVACFKDDTEYKNNMD